MVNAYLSDMKGSPAGKPPVPGNGLPAAGVVAVLHFIELFWFVAPTFHPDGFSLHWMTILAPVGIGGVWLWSFFGYLRGRSLLPMHDPRFLAILEEHGLAGHG